MFGAGLFLTQDELANSVSGLGGKPKDYPWQAHARGLIARVPRVLPIGTADYPTPAARPAYSVLDCSALRRDFGIELPDWRAGLATVLDRLQRG